MNLFKPFGIIYRPVSMAGYLLTVLILAVFIHDFIFIDLHSHSVSDLYYNFAPFGFMYVAAWLWIASKTSR